MMKQSNDLKIKCTDGFELSATIYTPTTLKAAVMIGPATGIKRIFYKAFATFLAENGYGVICFDNRGIGDSKNGSINKCNASLITWGQLDMPAVLRALQNHFPNTTYHLVGHSAGGQLLGLMDNATDIQSMFNFASSSGCIKNMRPPFKARAKFFMDFFIPISNTIFGQTNSQWVGMGEPLPKAVASQWSKWCNGEGYVKVDLGKAIQHHYYDAITIPSLWLHATDDDIANYENVKDMIRVYSKINAEIITLEPQKIGYDNIGHMKFFSSKYKQLWRYALDWFDSKTMLAS